MSSFNKKIGEVTAKYTSQEDWWSAHKVYNLANPKKGQTERQY